MEETRIKYLTYLIVGVIFVITGFALNELDILGRVTPTNVDEWIQFLSPWIGKSDGQGLPVPWN